MGLYDEQFRQRISHDDDSFADAFAAMAAVIMGERITRALNDDRIQTKNAVEEILKYYHIKPPELPDNIKDINDQLDYLLRPSGIMRRPVNLEGAWYKDATGALLGSRKDDGMPVALLPCGLTGYRFMDSKTGKWVRLNKSTAKLIDDEAVCFYRPMPQKKLSVKDLIVFMAHCMSVVDFALVGAAVLAVSLLGMLIPAIQRLIYGPVLQSTSLQLLFAVFGFLICTRLSQIFIGVTRQLTMSRLESKLNIQVQAACMMRMLSLPAKFYNGYSSGELAARVTSFNSMCFMLVSALLTTGLTSLFSLVYIVQMAAYGPGLVVPGMIVIICTVLVSMLTAIVQCRVSKRQMELAAKESGLEHALIAGVRKIRLAGAEKRAFAKWANAYAEQAKLQYDPPAFLKLSGVISSCISLVGTIVIYYFTITTRVPLADYYAFNSAYGMVMGAFASLTAMTGTVAKIRSILDMSRPIMEAVPEAAANKKQVMRLSGSIELNNVSFRYTENGPLVVDDLSLKIRPGQYVAIVGATGSGKSTLMRLLLGFETPQKGSIYYDGNDLSTLDLQSLRRNIGSVMQNGKLFHGDIYSNIVITAPQLTLQDAWDAAEKAGIADDIRAMPMEMHTIISEGAGSISGGQRQRLMIARAIAPKPRILMFDEATSALDNITQKIVSDSLDALKCTRIIIAHRLSTIKQCDRIIVLDKGRIIEDGTYDELTAKNGYFSELVARQRAEQ